MQCEFLQNAKQILEAYQKDKSTFRLLHSQGIESTSEPIIDVVQEIFKDGNLDAMQALIDAGFALTDNDNKSIKTGIFVSKQDVLKNDNYHDLLKSLHHATKQTHFFQLLELLIFNFKYVFNLNELHFILNDISYKHRILSSALLSWFSTVRTCALRTECLGHVLGLSGTVTASIRIKSTTSHVQVTMPFEGSFDIRSYNILINKMTTYKKSLTAKSPYIKHIDKIVAAFAYMLNQLTGLSGYHDYAPDRLRERYKNDEITNLIAGWFKHSIGLSLYKGFLILSNRGEGGDQDFGTKIYKIEGLITQEWVRKIIDKTLNGSELNTLLKRVVNLAKPIAIFPNKGQKHGTCSYVNILSSVEAQFCLLEAERLRKFTPAGIAQIAQQMTNPLTRNQGEYKKLTAFNRFTEINDLTKDINDNYKHKSGLNDLYLELCKAIILQHHGKATTNQVKKDNERQMVMQLFESLNEEHKKCLLDFFSIAHISELFQDEHQLVVSEEEIDLTFSDLTTSKPAKKIEVHQIQVMIDSLKQMDIEENEIVNLRSGPGSFASYYDTLKQMGAKSKKGLESKGFEHKPRYERSY